MRTRSDPRPTSADRGYSLAWRKASLRYRQQHPLCEQCARHSKVVPAALVDHITPLDAGGALLDPANLQSLCRPCHAAKTRADKSQRLTLVTGCDALGMPLDPTHPWARRHAAPLPDLPTPAVPVTLVCGAPGSGKSRHVAAHAAPQDTITDLDDILADLSGMPGHDAPRSYLPKALDLRNRQIASLAHQRHGQAWVVMCLADPDDRDAWRQALGHARVLVMTTPLAVCLRRIRTGRASSPRLQDMLRACRAWWDEYRPAPFDIPTASDEWPISAA